LTSSVSAQMLSHAHQLILTDISHRQLNLRPHMFEIPFFSERLDAVDEPLKFVQWEEQPNAVHILQYPHLFPEGDHVSFFRTVNFGSMMAQYNESTRTFQMHERLRQFLRGPHWFMIKRRTTVSISHYLVLDVSRKDPLKDTLDQLWGLERSMVQKPLKVQMGRNEGEVGADHGGVTYEFFRVVLSEAFKPDQGEYHHVPCLWRLTRTRHVYPRPRDAHDVVSAHEPRAPVEV
jgi:hypothetical protein